MIQRYKNSLQINFNDTIPNIYRELEDNDIENAVQAYKDDLYTIFESYEDYHIGCINDSDDLPNADICLSPQFNIFEDYSNIIVR